LKEVIFMMRSMYSGVSGLKAHQTRMDVIGNNIANINTIGYKSSRVTFKEMLSQTIKEATAPQGDRGGSNPQQIGLGVSLASIDVNHTPGSSQTTNIGTDLSIDGDGFFIYSTGSQDFYSRAGALTVDADGDLISAISSYKVQGYQLKNDGTADTSSYGDINIPRGDTMQAEATSEVDITGNLNTDREVGETVTTSIEVFDSLGNRQIITLTFEKTDNNQWDWTADWSDGTGLTNFDSGSITFDGSTGEISSIMPIDLSTFNTGDGADDIALDLDLSQLTQLNGSESFNASKDGNPVGDFESITIDQHGKVIGGYSNGRTRELAQIAIAIFANPTGLEKIGDSLFAVSSNSGEAVADISGTGGRGSITPGSLEMSNVDLAEQFADMITTQRGFQANSKIITVTDQMLQDLINLKR
jgi:flagellar hook protein FlgE